MDSISSINAIIHDLFIRDSHTRSLDPDLDLLQNGVCDSLGFLTIALEIEKRHPPIKILDQEIESSNFGSIRKICKFLESKGINPV
jgi:acyl carrier protein